jgi:hypothetical protein
MDGPPYKVVENANRCVSRDRQIDGEPKVLLDADEEAGEERGVKLSGRKNHAAR